MFRGKLAAITLGLTALLAYSAAWAATQTESATEKAPQPAIKGTELKFDTETSERHVDQAALSSQERSIATLSKLLGKYRGSAKEAVFLAKLGELKQENAAIRFRLAHGDAHRTRKAVDLGKYHKELNGAIATFSELIRKYPDFEEIPSAYFRRGKSYEELGKKGSATLDYLHLVKNFPDAPESPSAYMALAEFSIEANEHQKAIGYLKEVEKLPDNPHYPFALYKLAWAHYNLRRIPEALSYSEKQIAYYDSKAKSDGVDLSKPSAANVSNSDYALRENTLLDTAVFYLEGFEQDAGRYEAVKAYDYFKKLEKGPVLGRMILRFAKLLRSHVHETELSHFTQKILKEEFARPEALETLLVTYDFQLNRRRFSEMVASTQSMVALHKQSPGFDAWDRARKALLDTADEFQKTIVRNKNADGVKELSRTLASVYDSFTQIVDDSDPRIPRVHYNLAETLFTIGEFEEATRHYRWVVDRGSWSKSNADFYKVQVDSSLRAIASRYEVLRKDKQIPETLVAVSYATNKDAKLDGRLGEWVSWIDTHIGYSPKDTENFAFEAARTLYSQGRVREASSRMKALALANPESEYAIPAASLVIDTEIATADWERVEDLALDLLKIKNWKSDAFPKRLLAVAGDASYKVIEGYNKVGEYARVLKKVDPFLKSYPTSARVPDALTLAGTAALASGEKKRAMSYFTLMIQNLPKSETASKAFLARAKILEERFDFAEAAQDLRAFLSMPAEFTKLDKKESEKIRQKTLALGWLSGDPALIRSFLAGKDLCGSGTGEAMADCEKYRAVATLLDPERAGRPDVTDQAFERAHKGGGGDETRTLWAAVALAGAKKLPFRDRNVMLQKVVAGWSELDPLLRIAVLPQLTVSIPATVRMNREALPNIAPLRADEKWIGARVDKIREVEIASARVMKMEWSRLRADILNETAGLYLDLAQGLAALPAPKGLEGKELEQYQATIRKLVLPFEEKGQDMRSKAFEIASQSSVEEVTLASITETFFAENPSQAKTLRQPASTLLGFSDALSRSRVRPGELTPALMARLEPQVKWEKLLRSPESAGDDEGLMLRARWAQAVQSKNWMQMAFFLQEAQSRKLVAGGPLAAFRAITLAAAGARAEGLADLAAHLKDFPVGSEERKIAAATVGSYFMKTYAYEKARGLASELEAPEEKAQIAESTLPAATPKKKKN